MKSGTIGLTGRSSSRRIICGAAFGQAETKATSAVLVTDSTGAAVPGTTVTVLNIDTGVTKDYTTNDAGVYDTSSIVAGNYKLTFARQGFTTLVRPSITVPVGPTTVNAQLAVGTVSTQVVVNTDDVPLLNTENGTISTTLNSETLGSCHRSARSGRIGQASIFCRQGPRVRRGETRESWVPVPPMAPCCR